MKMSIRTLVCCFSATLSAVAVRGEIAKPTGAVKVVDAPDDVRTGKYEDDREIRVFPERSNYVTESSVTVDISRPGTAPIVTQRRGRKGRLKQRVNVNPNLSVSTIPAGTRINSYYIHYDPVGVSPGDRTASGSVTFEEKVLGIIISSSRLDESNGLLGLPGTSYPGGAAQGIELTKKHSITLDKDGRTVRFELAVSNRADNLRVITEASSSDSRKDRSRRNKRAKSRKTGEKRGDAKTATKEQVHLLPEGSQWSGSRTDVLH